MLHLQYMFNYVILGTEELELKLDINTANIGELCKLPGVGSALAERIIATRPFVDLDDLTRVSGLGSVFVKKLIPYIVDPFAVESDESFESDEIVPDVEDEDLPEVDSFAIESDESFKSDEIVPDVEDEDLPEDEELFSEEESEVSPTLSVIPASINRREVLMMVIGGSFLALLLALIFTFSILSGLNGGNLRFSSRAEINNIGNQLDGINTQLTILEDDISGLRTRLDNLEMLGKRISTVENTLETLNEEFEILQIQNDDVQTLMKSLRDLLLEIFPPTEATQ